MKLKLSLIAGLFLLVFNAISQNKYEMYHYEGLEKSSAVNDILLTDGSGAYIAADDGLFYVPSVSMQARKVSPNTEVAAISNLKNKEFAYGGNNKFSFSKNPGKLYDFGDKSVKVSSMAFYKNDLWIGTNDGLYIVNLKRNKVIHHFVPNNSDLVSKQINFIYPDKYGVLWVGTANGVIRINDEDWKIYEKRHSMEGVFENKEGLWLLSNKELWNIDNIDKANRWYRLNLKKDLKKGMVNDLVVDSRGRLIIASDVLTRFDPYSGKVQKYGKDLGLVSRKCSAIAIDSEDKIWIGTPDKGLYTVGFKDHYKAPEKNAPLEFVLISKSPSCHDDNDGSIKVMIKGGKKPYKFFWSTGDVDVKKIENLTAGDYALTIVDAKKDSLVKSVSLINPEKLTISVKSIEKNITGAGSIVEFDVKGGTPGYRLEIDGFSTDLGKKNVSYGKHEARVIDVMGCDAYVDFEVAGEKVMSGLDAKKIRVGQVLRINNLYFQADSVDITEKSKTVLDEIFEFLNN
ncbi:MAG TPA: hypothetical protein ENK91_09280, partial [Bacteroidetes bacterium]|nr:hypothetical protein [Bacteroidota bacterium]